MENDELEPHPFQSRLLSVDLLASSSWRVGRGDLKAAEGDGRFRGAIECATVNERLRGVSKPVGLCRHSEDFLVRLCSPVRCLVKTGCFNFLSRAIVGVTRRSR